jgi:hypothetical protein
MPHAGAASDMPPPADANTESFFSSRVDPQWGQAVPFQSLDRTSSSLSFPHLPHSNS